MEANIESPSVEVKSSSGLLGHVLGFRSNAVVKLNKERTEEESMNNETEKVEDMNKDSVSNPEIGNTMENTDKGTDIETEPLLKEKDDD